MKEKTPFPLVFFFFDLAGLIKVGFVLRECCISAAEIPFALLSKLQGVS